MTRRRRVLLMLFTTLLVSVLALWLMLPRLAGFALSHWLELPGVSGLALRFDAIGWQQVRIASLQFRYQSETGDIADVQARDVLLEIEPFRQQISRVHVEHATLSLQLSEGDTASGWPTIQLPRLPFDDLQIKTLTLTMPDVPLLNGVSASLEVQQNDSSAIYWQAQQGRKRLLGEISEQPSALAVDLVLFENIGHESKVRIQFAADPSSQPVKIDATLDFSEFGSWLALFPDAANPAKVSGKLTLASRVTLAERVGQWQNAETNLHIQSVQLQTEQALFALAGSATLQSINHAREGAGALPMQFNLQWQPGTTFDVKMADTSLGGGRVELAEPFTLQWQAGTGESLPGQLTSDGPLRLHWRSANFGDWQLDLRSLTIADSLNAALQVAGSLPHLERAPLQANALQINGTLQLQLWSSDGHRLQIAVPKPMQISADSVSVNTSTPWQLHSPVFRWQGLVGLVEDSTGWRLHEADATLSGTKLSAEITTAQIHLQDWHSRVRFDGSNWQGQWQTRQAELQQTSERYTSGPLTITVKRFDGNDIAELDVSAKALTSSMLRGWPQPDLQAALKLENDALRFRGGVRVREQELLQFAGTHDLDREHGQATLSWQRDLAELDRLLQPRPSALAALGPISGRSDGNMNLQWQLNAAPLDLQVNGLMRLADANLQWQEATAKQINAEVALDRLAPLQGRLSLGFPSATLAAGMTASDNRLQLSLVPVELQLDQFTSKLLGGHWQASKDTLPLSPSEKSLPIRVDGLALDQILALIDLEGLSGEGTLDGVLPLVNEAAGLAVRDGLLQSRVSGALRYAPASVAIDNPGLQALRDFHYQNLRIQLDYHGDGSYLIRLKLDGNNPSFYHGFPIALTLNLKGQLPGLLRAAILSGDFNAHVLEQLQTGSPEP